MMVEETLNSMFDYLDILYNLIKSGRALVLSPPHASTPLPRLPAAAGVLVAVGAGGTVPSSHTGGMR